MIFNAIEYTEKKSTAFRGEKYRFTDRKVPLFEKKNGTFS